MLVRPDDGGVDHDVFKVWIVRHRGEQSIPNTVFGPSREADEDAIPIAKTVRQVAPGNACPCEPQYRLHEQAIVRARPTRITRLARQVRPYPLPLAVSQHQSNRRHPTLLEKELESDLRPSRNLECQRALGEHENYPQCAQKALPHQAFWIGFPISVISSQL